MAFDGIAPIPQAAEAVPVNRDAHGLRPRLVASGKAPVVFLHRDGVRQHPGQALRAKRIQHREDGVVVQILAVVVQANRLFNSLLALDVLLIGGAVCVALPGLTGIVGGAPIDGKIM